jgi:hypothetical protein
LLVFLVVLLLDLLLGVKLNNELLAHWHIDLITKWQITHCHFVVSIIGLKPHRDRAVESVEVVANNDHRLRFGA